MRFHGGVQYARIQTDVNNFLDTALDTAISTEFTGFGPRTGLDELCIR